MDIRYCLTRIVLTQGSGKKIGVRVAPQEQISQVVGCEDRLLIFRRI